MASPSSESGRPRILFIDAYDSFSNNIVALLKTNLEETVEIEVTVIQIDADIPDFPKFLKGFDAVVAGPGPGDPRKARDVGLMRKLWSLQDVDLLPVLGICLGFQSLVLAFGGNVEMLRDPRHGIETYIDHNDNHIFYGLGEIKAVQYHSFHASLFHVLPPEPVSVFPEHLFKSTRQCPKLVPLAWDATDTPSAVGYSKNPQFILMAVSHVDWKKPFCGIQFHPESISSSEKAQQVVRSWWSVAKQWIQECGSNRKRAGQLKEYENMCATQKMLRMLLPPAPDVPLIDREYDEIAMTGSSTVRCLSKTVFGTERVLTVPAICDLLGIYESDCIVLDSEMQAMQDATTTSQGANTGTHSIIGIIEPATMRIEYKVGSAVVNTIRNGLVTCEDLSRYGGSIFTFLKDFMSRHKAQENFPNLVPVPFCGGLMGYITYEGCLETIGVDNHYIFALEAPFIVYQPDVCFAFVERSIVVNHRSKDIHIQTIKELDHDWLKYAYGMLRQSDLPSPHCFELMQTYGIGGTELQHRKKLCRYFSSICKTKLPVLFEYEMRFQACREKIRWGLSYELCLTDQTVMTIPSLNDSSVYEDCDDRHPLRFKRSMWNASPVEWSMYLRLRNINPAPFSAYVRLGPLTLLSTSPERFMSWDRPHGDIDDDGNSAIVQNCQFRPIKGTVKKSNPDGTRLSLEEATKLLGTTKERAENLMIVDLIRHDLHGVLGAGNVHVPQLMVVEEYATVYQLVSVIEGKLSRTQTPDKTPIDVLAASLPPGSMTGAPKLRTCQLLKRVDGHKPRSVYSGVLGYMCVTGRGDFSVVIRSMYKWAGGAGPDKDAWHLGAGGAITALSTEKGEWEEMLLKLESTLRLFRGAEFKGVWELEKKAKEEVEKKAKEAAAECETDSRAGTASDAENASEAETALDAKGPRSNYEAPRVEEVVDEDDL